MKSWILLFLLGVSGCTHVVWSNARALQNLDRTQTNLARFAVRADIPAGFDLLPDQPWLAVSMRHAELEEPLTIEGPLQVHRMDGQFVISIATEDLAQAEAFQKVSQTWVQEGKENIQDYYDLQLKGCLTGEPYDLSERISISVRWDAHTDFQPLLKNVPMRKFLKRFNITDPMILPACP